MNRFAHSRVREMFVLIGACFALAPGAAPEALAQAEDPASAQVIPLEKRSYIRNLKVLAQHFPDSDRYGKLQMMAIGSRRYLFQAYRDLESDKTVGVIVDVSNPLNPIVVRDKAWDEGFQLQLGYNESLKKWILVTGQSFHRPSGRGLRGVEIFDVTDPAKPTLLSRWSVDGGDPSRTQQTGHGTHRFWYDGGRYLYLSAAPDNNFYFPEYRGLPTAWGYSFGLQIVDLADPVRPKLVANWHIPGQRYDEAEARAAWSFATDPVPKPFLHGPVYVPRKLEKGGVLGYGSWGSFGMVIHDFSDVAHPKVLSTWRPEPANGPQIAVHTVDVARLDRGFVITNPEAIAPQCRETQVPMSIVDVSDPRNPRRVADLPLPVPPAEAPYKSFCERYGRFVAHNPPHLKAPGKPHPSFTCYTFFSGGLQCYDIEDISHPRIVAYFVPGQGPPQARSISNPGSATHWIRTVDNVFIEWDRRLIWVAADTGLYLLSATSLGSPVLKPMRVERWALPDLNSGAP